VQRAFLDVSRNLQTGTLSESQKEAIDSLPYDKITGKQ
jgi:hypothetical protein